MRILGRFRRLHPNVAVRTKACMALMQRAVLDGGEPDTATVGVFSHELRPSDVGLFRETRTG